MTGLQHARLHLAFGILGGSALAILAHRRGDLLPVGVAIGLCAGYLLGALVTPDWDLPRTRAHRIVGRIPLFGALIVAWMRLYAALVNWGRPPFVHRGLSHWPIIGTLTRVVWLGAPVTLVCALTDLPFLSVVPTDAKAWAMVGLCASDLVHLLGDGFRIKGARRK